MVIKELTTSQINDWFDFFDNRAFADHEDWSGCYCTAFYSPRPEEYISPNKKRRDYAKWLIENGRMKGYLAYENGKIIGWVNCNDKSQFPRLNEINLMNDKVLSIVCFIVEKEHRRKGIAQKLLNRIIKDANDKGFSIIEAYPKKKATSEYGTWNGPYEMYIKNGFEDFKIEKSYVVRRLVK
jgi:GNAT superfamily N-acetyltransferase